MPDTRVLNHLFARVRELEERVQRLDGQEAIGPKKRRCHQHSTGPSSGSAAGPLEPGLPDTAHTPDVEGGDR